MISGTLKISSTNDAIIRNALKKELLSIHATDKKVRIIEELGVRHGSARMDIAVINGIMHGYEIKSDKDTLQRLPEQMNIYNSVFDEITLVVGKTHLFESINLIPDWWGVTIAKTIGSDDKITFNIIRKAQKNPLKNRPAIAKLLWREEALEILEELGKADGLRSKPRSLIYEKLSSVLSPVVLGEKVR